MALGDDADEGNLRRAGRAGVVHRVADIPQLASGLHLLNRQEAVRSRLGVGDMFGADDRVEALLRGESSQSDVELIAQAPGEDGQIETPIQAVEKPRFGQPGFALDQAVAVTAEEDLVEVIDHCAVLDLHAEIGGDLLRKSPIVVPAAGVLVLLHELVVDAFSGKVRHGLDDRGAVGCRDFGQHAVHVENDYRVHRLSSSSRNRCVCSGRPKVTRTHPAIS